MNRKVLLTGASGLIGRGLQNSAPDDVQLILTSKTQYDSFDLTSLDQIKPQLDVWAPDVIIHTSAVTSVDYAENHKEECNRLNVLATEQIAEWCQEHAVSLTFFSTDFVFDGSRNDFCEDDATAPLSLYGRSKIEAEELIKSLVVDHLIIRPILVYGYEPELSRLNLPLLIASKLSSGQSMKITSDQYRMPTYVGDVAESTWRMIETGYRGTVHLSGQEYVSVLEFAKLVCEEFDLDSSLLEDAQTNHMSQVGMRPMISGFDCSKAESLINYSPKSIREGLRTMAEKMRS